MVEQVSAVGAQKVYSSDKKIFSGMSVRDAGKDEKSMQIFNFADKNENGKIDDFELKRYDGPIIQYNNYVNNAKVKGRNELSSAKYELYTGQKIEDVPKELRNEYVKTDINKDGELSLAEMARKQIKVETGFDVEVSEDMSKKDMCKLITQKRNEKKAMQNLNELVNNANKSRWDLSIEGTNSKGEDILILGGASVATAGGFSFLGGIASGMIGAAGAGLALAVGFPALVAGLAVGEGTIYYAGNRIKNSYKKQAIADLNSIQQQYANDPAVQAQIEQLKKANPWLTK